MNKIFQFISLLLILTSQIFANWEETKVTKNNGVVDDYFGHSVSISGDRAIVGVIGDNDNGSYSGSAYIYKWNGTSWIKETKLTASDAAAGDCFGYSVSISGNRAIVGAEGDDDRKGSVYIYDWNDSSWVETKLTASDGVAGDWFGQSVSISGNRAIVAAEGDDEQKGSAYIYDWNDSSWVETKLTASDGTAGDWFGHSVSISGDRAIVGADGDNNNGISSGSAYIYTWDGSSWIETKLTVSDGIESESFGNSVSISGNRAIVGAHADNDKGEYSGSAYIYTWNGDSWVENKLTASDGVKMDYFGLSVAISGDRAIVGADGDDDKGSFSGSAYIYTWNGSSWIESKLMASDGTADDYFGWSVSISGDRAIVGADADDDKGSAYIYNYNDQTDILGLSQKNSDKLLIYPNPVTDIINIESSINGEIVIMNLQGKVTRIVNNNITNVSKLPKGIYFAVVKENGEIKAVKSFYKR